jgi:hypothetical protein
MAYGRGRNAQLLARPSDTAMLHDRFEDAKEIQIDPAHGHSPTLVNIFQRLRE